VPPWYSPHVRETQAADTRIVLSTFPDPDQAAAIARILVEEQLAACVNLLPGVRSIYRWQGAVESATETLAIIKTTAGRYDALASRLVSLHPYEVPELIAVSPVAGHAPYFAWIAASTLEP